MAKPANTQWDDIIKALYMNGYRARRIHKYIHEYAKKHLQIDNDVISLSTVENRCRALRRQYPNIAINESRLVLRLDKPVDAETYRLAAEL